MEVVDINFNFELLRDGVNKSIEKYNKAFDNVMDLQSICKNQKKIIDDPNANPYFKELYQGVLYKQDTKNLVIATIADLRVATKNMEANINNLIKLMKMRDLFIEMNYSQKELFDNYKLMAEQNELKKEIAEYEKIKDFNVSMANGIGLDSFGLEIEGEPGMN